MELWRKFEQKMKILNGTFHFYARVVGIRIVIIWDMIWGSDGEKFSINLSQTQL